MQYKWWMHFEERQNHEQLESKLTLNLFINIKCSDQILNTGPIVMNDSAPILVEKNSKLFYQERYAIPFGSKSKRRFIVKSLSSRGMA